MQQQVFNNLARAMDAQAVTVQKRLVEADGEKHSLSKDESQFLKKMLEQKQKGLGSGRVKKIEKPTPKK